MGQFLHLRLLAVEFLEFGVVVKCATRDVVDEGFRRSAVGEDDLVRFGLDMIDRVFVAEFGQRTPGYRSSVDQGPRLA